MKNTALTLVRENYVKIILFSVLFLFLYFLLGPTVKFAIVIVLFISLGALSTMYYNFFHGPINFELVKLGTILISITYGVWPAIMAGIIASILGRVLSGRIDHRTILSIFGIIVMATAAHFFAANASPQNIVWIGTGLVILYHAILTPLSLALGDRPWFLVPYALSNIFFNFLLFKYIAPFLLPAIQP